MFVLFYTVFAIVAVFLDALLGLGFLYILYALGLFIPAIAVMVRRLHDVGKSGWWWLINLIPLVGAIWFLVLMCTDSNSGDNKYGPSPKASTVPEEKAA